MLTWAEQTTVSNMTVLLLLLCDDRLELAK